MAFLKRLVEQLLNNNTAVLASAVSFYTFLSIFPAISALVSLYGLFADPIAVRTQIEHLRQFVPPDALSLLERWIDTLVARPRANLGTGLVVSLSLSLWTARSAAGTLMTTLNVAYGQEEQRSFLIYNIVALALTLLFLLLGLATILLLAILPAILSFGSVPEIFHQTTTYVRWILQVFIIASSISLLFRFGPHREQYRLKDDIAGIAVATALWLAGSYALTVYVARFADYDNTYGSIGAIIILLLWFWLCAYAVLAGATLNSLCRRPITAINK